MTIITIIIIIQIGGNGVILQWVKKHLDLNIIKSVTFIIEKDFQTKTYFCSSLNIIKIKDPNDLNMINTDSYNYSMYTTLTIKIDKTQKHSSHELFLVSNGFADSFKRKYIFCNEAYAIYDLINYLDNHPASSSATGRHVNIMNINVQLIICYV